MPEENQSDDKGKSKSENFVEAVKKIVSLSKEEVERIKAEEKKKRG